MQNRYRKFSLMIYILIIIVILAGLNINKIWQNRDDIVPVWSSEDSKYYNRDLKMITRIKNIFSPENLLYRLTRIRPRVPITYLKQEIPLLGYYTPEDLQKQEEVVYLPDDINEKSEERVIRLQFDMRSNRTNIEDEITKVSEQKQEAILIYHSHTSETYADDPRNQDNNGHVMPGEIGNVARVGMELANILSTKYNFPVIHSTRIHDQEYVRSYYNSRQTVKGILQENSNISMVFDIHRDGLKDFSEDAYTANIRGQNIAKIMIVVTNGKFDFAHLDITDHHQEWQRNLDFARRMAAKMEEMYPGLLKRIEIRDTTYNQDLHPHSLLLEVGDYRNTTREALRSARFLADVIAALNNEI